MPHLVVVDRLGIRQVNKILVKLPAVPQTNINKIILILSFNRGISNTLTGSSFSVLCAKQQLSRPCQASSKFLVPS